MRLKALKFNAFGDAIGCNANYRIYETRDGIFNLTVFPLDAERERLATNISESEAVIIANEHHKETVMKLFDLEIDQ